jgi:putative hydrolase of the HAD superfamily
VLPEVAVLGGPLDGVLLDVDDTLVDTRHAFSVGIAAVTRSWLGHLGPDAAGATLAHWLADAGGHFRAYTRGEISFTEQRRRRATAMHLAFGGPSLDEADFARWAAEYEQAFRSAWRAFPEAAAFLDRIADLGLPCAAVTNAAGNYQLDKLRRVDLAHRLAFVLGNDELGFGKPDPAVFTLACRRLGTAPGRTLYVGDELDVDARGGRDAGLIGVWLRRAVPGGPATDYDVPVVCSLIELADQLEAAVRT